MRRALVVLALALLGGCARELVDLEPMHRDQSGTLRVVLEGHAHDGTSYLLRDSTLEISGSALLTLSARPSDGAALSTPLPSGAYSLFLRPGYRVVKVQAGSEQPVAAELATENPRRFALGPLEEATVPLVFTVAGERVVFGGSTGERMTSLLPVTR